MNESLSNFVFLSYVCIMHMFRYNKREHALYITRTEMRHNTTAINLRVLHFEIDMPAIYNFNDFPEKRYAAFRDRGTVDTRIWKLSAASIILFHDCPWTLTPPIFSYFSFSPHTRRSIYFNLLSAPPTVHHPLPSKLRVSYDKRLARAVNPALHQMKSTHSLPSHGNERVCVCNK